MAPRTLRVAVVGSGTAGASAALLLARDGHRVEIFERVAAPAAVGAGILLQPLGVRVLADLGLAAALRAVSTPVRRIDATTRSGRRVLDFPVAGRGDDDAAWGVHRSALFGLLAEAVADAGVPLHAGTEVQGVEWTARGVDLYVRDGRRIGGFDLVVGADGARSRLRRSSGLARVDVGYPYGVLWSVVPDPDGIVGDVLWQCYDDTRVTLGVLPTGTAQASIFWSIRSRDIPAALAAGPGAWVRRARPYARHLGALVERVTSVGLLGARYRDVVVRAPGRARDGAGLVLIGDAAHAMSPQLGLGASLALADAWTLAWAIRTTGGDVGAALERHARARGAHVRWYTWCSRLMTPVFQSDLVPVGWGRDLLVGPAGRIPWVRRQLALLLDGRRTSPFGSWDLPT